MAIADKLTERELVMVRALIDVWEDSVSGSLEMATAGEALQKLGLGIEPWRAGFDRNEEGL